MLMPMQMMYCVYIKNKCILFLFFIFYNNRQMMGCAATHSNALHIQLNEYMRMRLILFTKSRLHATVRACSCTNNSKFLE